MGRIIRQPGIQLVAGPGGFLPGGNPDRPVITAPTADQSFDDDDTIGVVGTYNAGLDTAIEVYANAVKDGDAVLDAGDLTYDLAPANNVAGTIAIRLKGDVTGWSSTVVVNVTLVSPVITSHSNGDTLTAGASDTVSGTCPDDTAGTVYIGDSSGAATVAAGAFDYGFTVPDAQEDLEIYFIGNNSGTSATITVDVEEGVTRDTPLGDIVPSCVYDLDVTIEASWNNVDRRLRNLEPTPADGSAQSDYDFLNANSVITNSADMTFNGTVDDPAAYLEGDGSDFMQIEGGNTPFLRDLHKPGVGSDITVIAAGKTPALGVIHFHGQLSARRNFIGQWTSSETRVQAIQLGNTGEVKSTFKGPANSADASGVFVFTKNAAATSLGATRNSATTTVTTVVPNASSDDPFADYRIFAGGGLSASGSHLYSIAVFNAVLSEAEITAAIEHLELRHNRTYL